MLAAMLAQLDASFEDAKAECDTLAEESSAWLKETVTRTEKQLLNHTCVRRNPLRAAAGPCEQSARRLRMWHGAASLPDHMRIARLAPGLRLLTSRAFACQYPSEAAAAATLLKTLVPVCVSPQSPDH